MSQDIENKNANSTIENASNVKLWKYNGFEIEYDITDIDIAERYEKAFEIMGEKENELPKVGKKSELLKAQYNWFAETFDRLFGEGSADKILGGKKSIALCMDAYENFLAFIAKQNTNLINKGQRINSSYSNRAQRRAAVKTKK